MSLASFGSASIVPSAEAFQGVSAPRAVSAYTADELLALSDRFGAERAMAYAEKVLDAQNRVYAYAFSSIRAGSRGASSVGSSSPPLVSRPAKAFSSTSSPPPSRGGVGISRYAAVRGLATWRSAKVVKDGYCYAKSLTLSARDDVVASVGEWPTVREYLSQNIRSFESPTLLETFRLVPTGPGKFHLAAGGTEGYPLMDEMSAVAAGAGFPRGSMGAYADAFVAPPTTSGVTLDSRIGGGGSPESARVPGLVVELVDEDAVIPFGAYGSVNLYSRPAAAPEHWFVRDALTVKSAGRLFSLTGAGTPRSTQFPVVQCKLELAGESGFVHRAAVHSCTVPASGGRVQLPKGNCLVTYLGSATTYGTSFGSGDSVFVPSDLGCVDVAPTNSDVTLEVRSLVI